MKRSFLSGNEALAHAVRLSRPHVISAYPITPQTTVVEALADMVADGDLQSEFIHVESEHSALCCAIGASSVGARTFTATSSQGLLYMAECLPYAAGGRFPIVMMNANRSTALPWNIHGDQRDSLSLLDMGWIQSYAENAQEGLDMTLMAYYIAEHADVQTPFMVNLDGFHVTHTYETVEIPSEEQACAFLPDYQTENKMDPAHPRNLAFTAGPAHNAAFKLRAHQGLLRAGGVVVEAEARYAAIMGREYSGLLEAYCVEDAEYVIVTLGSIAGLCRDVVDSLRDAGQRVGMLRIRYMRPFPGAEIAAHLAGVKAIGVLEKDISFGNEGTVYSEVNSALFRAGRVMPSMNFVGGLGGRDITRADIERAFAALPAGESRVCFIGYEGEKA